jgi:hypothetical protein
MTKDNPENCEDLPTENPLYAADVYAELLALAEDGNWREFIEWVVVSTTGQHIDGLKEFVDLWAQMRSVLGLPPGWE